MQYAIDSNEKRIEASWSGEIALCPLCRNEVKAYCGKINIKHWRHISKINCDSWSEGETEWHRKWKEHFHESWREIIIDSNGEKHIADIKTPNELVIEFQNSSISSTDIRIRENFYQNMFWVINVHDFTKNFEMKSLVKSKLETIQLEADIAVEKLNKDSNYHINQVQKEYWEKISEQNKISNEIDFKESLINAIDKCDQQELMASLMSSWSKKEHFHHKFLYSPLITIQNEFMEEVYNCYQLKQATQQKIEKITRLENYDVDGRCFKIVPYNKISPEHFTNVIAIQNIDNDTLFSVTKSFSTKEDFQNFKRHEHNYFFVANFDELLVSLSESLVNVCKRQSDLEQKIASDINSTLKEKLLLTKNELNDKIEQLNTLKLSLELLEEELENNKKGSDSIIQQKTKEITKNTNQKIIEAIKNLKGYYYLEWKHERKCWQSAKCQLYFDTCNGYLFKLINNNMLEKISYDDFISSVSQTKIFSFKKNSGA